METILNQLDDLRTLTGNSQVALLRSFKSELLKQILEYTYDTHKKYKIDEGKYNKVVIDTTLNTIPELDLPYWEMFVQHLNKLSEMKSATDQTVMAIKQFIQCLEQPRHQDFLKMVLFKDLRLNMGIKKFQMVWPDFCVEPQVQLAKPIEDRQLFANSKYSRKFDGKRVWWTDYVPMSRTNKQCSIPPIQHIIDELRSGPSNLCDFILDGELLYFEDGKEDFQKGISLCQRDDRLPGCENICYVIFDMILKDCFYNKTQDIPFEQEYQRLLDMLYDSNGTSLVIHYYQHILLMYILQDKIVIMKI